MALVQIILTLIGDGTCHASVPLYADYAFIGKTTGAIVAMMTLQKTSLAARRVPRRSRLWSLRRKRRRRKKKSLSQ